MYPLDTYIQVLTANNGALKKSADILGVPLHALRSKIAEHAELQAIICNRDIEIADVSRDIILGVLGDPLVEDLAKLSTAKWALENLSSDVYNKKQVLAVESKPIEELTAEELAARKAALALKMSAAKPEMSFNSLELEFSDPMDTSKIPSPRGDAPHVDD